ncbi:hypothetical protein D3C72_2139200 [compost metagenome]
MPDKTAWHIESVIKRFFERQKSQHHIGGSAYFENTFLSPCPDGRADVVNSFNTLFFQVAFEGDIEIRRINANKDIGLKIGKTTREIGSNMQQTA